MVVVDYKTFVGVTISKLNLNYKIKKKWTIFSMDLFMGMCVCVEW